MENILHEINKVRQKLKRNATDTLLMQKPFAEGMYRFSMFMVGYYARVRDRLELDYDSFMIIQTVVSTSLYSLKKKKSKSKSYTELEKEWDNQLEKYDNFLDFISEKKPQKNYKLTISSICLVTSLPKETVRRKVKNLVKKNLLTDRKKQGILLGPMYKKIFQNFVPQTTLEVSRLLKDWEKIGVLKNLLQFKM